MQLIRETKEVFTSGVQESDSFSIEIDPIACKLLANDIYPNKALAVVREYTTNAADAHVQVGNPNPIEIHLPTALESYFSVKDYGPGLSSEDIKIYTKYFASTKRDRADQAGCFGLGSKAGFAYSDSFTVISRYNGKKSTYSCHKDNIFKPQRDLLSVTDWDGPNGIEVLVPVKKDDIWKFTEEAKKILPYLDVPYKVNVANFPEKAKPIMEGKNWKLYPGEGTYYVRQCGIRYPIPREYQDRRLDQFLTPTNNITFEAESGTLSVALSREALSFDDHTIENLKKLFDGVYQEYLEKLQAEIDKEPDIKAAIRKVLNEYPYCAMNLSYRGVSFDKLETHGYILAPTDLQVKMLNTHYRGYNTTWKTTNSIHYDVRKEVNVIIHDCRINEGLVSGFAQDNLAGTKIYIKAAVAYDNGKSVYPSKETVESLLYFLNPDNVYYTSAIDRATAVAKPKTTRPFYVLDGATGYRRKFEYYANSSYHWMTETDWYALGYHCRRSVLQVLRKCGLQVDHVIIVKEKNKKKFNNNQINVADLFSKYSQKYPKTKYLVHDDNKLINHLIKHNLKIKTLALKYNDQLPTNLEWLQEIRLYLKEPMIEVENMKTELYDKYPMLKYINDWATDQNTLDDALNYANLI